MIYKVQYIKPRFKLILKFKREILGFAGFLLFIAFLLLLPYTFIPRENQDLRIFWLFVIQPVITYKLILWSIILGFISLFLDILNTRKRPCKLQILNETFLLETKKDKISLDFADISIIRIYVMQFTFSSYVKYRVIFPVESNEYMIHFKVKNDKGCRGLLNFLINDNRLRYVFNR
jgi:hypothetical protein